MLSSRGQFVCAAVYCLAALQAVISRQHPTCDAVAGAYKPRECCVVRGCLLESFVPGDNPVVVGILRDPLLLHYYICNSAVSSAAYCSHSANLIYTCLLECAVVTANVSYPYDSVSRALGTSCNSSGCMLSACMCWTMLAESGWCCSWYCFAMRQLSTYASLLVALNCCSRLGLQLVCRCAIPNCMAVSHTAGVANICFVRFW